jgi:hypothetical protein
MRLHSNLLTFAALVLALPLAAAQDASTSSPMSASDPLSFLRPGEKLVFKLGWGLVSSAGETTIETFRRETPEDPARVRVLTESRGIVKTFYPLENDSTCYIDPETGRPQRIEITGRDGKRETKSTTIFDYEAGEVRHTDDIRPHRSGTAELPDEPVYDIMVTMLQVREWNLKPGDVRRVKIAFDDDIYDIELAAIEEDRVRTPAGRFDAILVQPRQLGEPKGFFAKGGSMKFWISRGDDPQIVRMDFRVKVGTISSTLVEVQES